MGIIRVIIELFVLYLLYKLVFDFIIPVYRTTRQVNRKMTDMQTKMDEHLNRQQAGMGNTSKKPAGPAREDYIEFEEVK